MALSGGGIRAAAFSTGALQALEKKDVLRHVDYISSVSGGGFAASTLLTGTEKALSIGPRALDHMRRWASYLAPHGLFSFSGAALVITYLFGLLLNLLYYLGWVGTFTAAWLFILSAPETHACIASIGLLVVPFVVVTVWWAASNCFVPSDEAGALRRRAHQRYGLYVMVGCAVLVGAFWASRHGVDRLIKGTHGTDLYKLVATASAALVALVPGLAREVYRTLQDPKTVRRLSPLLIPGFVVAMVVAAVLLHTAVWILIRNYLSNVDAPHGLVAVDAPVADSANASGVLALCSLVLTGIAWYIRQFIAFEHVSLHFFFRDRIAEAFVLERGAEDADAGLRLAALLHRTELPVWIINATMNVRSRREGLNRDVQRRAAPFEFTSAHCGFGSSYRPTHEYAAGLSVASATAISAAAIAPRMGFYTRGLLPALMSMLNLRLGVKLPNPKHQSTRWKKKPGELRPNESYEEGDRDCYLSDGGHFDNLGLYALLRRRCRFIVAIDAEADSDYAFVGLGTLTRVAAVDLGCSIELDIAPLRPSPLGVSSAACAIGMITYDDGSKGKLLYVKAGYIDGLAPDLVAFRAKHVRFPHEGTANQLFDEAHFEAYRSLGCELVGRALALHDPAQFRGLSRMFVDAEDALSTTSSATGEMFQRTTDRFIELETQAMSGTTDAYDRELYPMPKVAKADFHFILGQIQLMEQVYLGCQLERTFARPENAGWVRLFERFAASPTFRSVWHHAGDIFGTSFHRFCEQRLGLPLPMSSRQPDVIALSVPTLRGDEPVRWRYSPSVRTDVRYELSVEQRVDNAWKKRATFNAAAPWVPAITESFDGHVRMVVRALSAETKRELATGELEKVTYRDSLARIQKTGRVVVGIHVDNGGSPFCFPGQSGVLERDPEGLDIQLASALAHRLGEELGTSLELSFRHFNWPAILTAPEQHEIDFVVASVAARPEREKQYNLIFTQPYYEAKTVLVRRNKDISAEPTGIDDKTLLSKLMLGVQGSTVVAEYVASLGIDRVRAVSTTAELTTMLREGIVDGVVCDNAQHEAFEDCAAVVLSADTQYHSIALSAVNRLLASRLNQHLAAIGAEWIEQQLELATKTYRERLAVATKKHRAAASEK